jgi:hypothetical protein
MSARQTLRQGYGVFGVGFVRFTLTYDGSLPASANKPKNQEKWDIRLAIAPQLRDLWTSHPALKTVEDNRYFPKFGGMTLTQVHHLHGGPVQPVRTSNFGGAQEFLDLCAPIEKHGAWFRPLVRDTYALHCGLKITFLRQEPPGKIYQGGDLDGRMKTLIDALAMPQHKEQILGPATKLSPIFCLLEDDALVSGLEIESERLLTDTSNPPDYVRLNIEVDVRVRQAMIYNQSFLG